MKKYSFYKLITLFLILTGFQPMLGNAQVVDKEFYGRPSNWRP